MRTLVTPAMSENFDLEQDTYNDVVLGLAIASIALTELLPFIKQFGGNGILHSIVLITTKILRAVLARSKHVQEQPVTASDHSGKEGSAAQPTEAQTSSEKKETRTEASEQ